MRRDRVNPEKEEQIRTEVLSYGLQAINHHPEVGGAGMTIVQQCIVNEEVGSSTGALWGRVWQPPVCLKDGTPEQVEKYLIPACRGEISHLLLHLGAHRRLRCRRGQDRGGS